MAYLPNIPAATDKISDSQPQIQANFNAIDDVTTGFAVDHVTLTDGTNGGKHKKVTLVAQGAPPAPPVQMLDLYNELVGGIAQFFMIRNGETKIQMSSGGANAGTSTSYGQSFLPGAFQIKFGFESGGSVTGSVVYQDGTHGLTNFPTDTIVVLLTAGNNARQLNVTSKSSTGFTYASSPSGFGPEVYWIAIGY